jgi:predicted nucleic acid-binding protein
MFVLDTNVISEIFAPKPAREVVDWIDRRGREDYWVTAITRAELLLGVLILPEGDRRQKFFGFINEFSATS